jgi:hypothetical protein
MVAVGYVACPSCGSPPPADPPPDPASGVDAAGDGGDGGDDGVDDTFGDDLGGGDDDPVTAPPDRDAYDDEFA